MKRNPRLRALAKKLERSRQTISDMRTEMERLTKQMSVDCAINVDLRLQTQRKDAIIGHLERQILGAGNRPFFVWKKT